MNDDLHELAAAYALDALDPDERAAFEAHLERCERCRAELEASHGVVEALARPNAVAPPAHVRDSVMARIAATPQQPAPERAVASLAEHGRRRRRTTTWLAAAAAVVAVVAGGFVIAQRLDDDRFDEVVAADDAITSVLDGETGAVEVTWSPTRDEVAVSAEGLGLLEGDVVWALWAIVGEQPVPAGLFESADGSFRDVIEVGDVDPVAWGITIEPAGGSEQPTGEILYFGEV